MREVTIIGAGRTGRGMLGELFDASKKFHLNFADSDLAIIEKLRNQGYYEVEMKNLLTGEKSIRRVSDFEHFHIFDDRESYIKRLADSEIIATALFPEDFDQAIKDIIEAIKLKYRRNDNHPSAVILGANYVGLKDYFYPRIKNQLLSDEQKYFEELISVVGSNANRKITFPEHDNGDLLLVGDDKPVLMVNDSFKFPENYDYPKFMVKVPNIELKMIEKIWSENLEHIALGFLGNYKGYKTVNEAISDPYIRKVVYYAWKEAREAMYKNYDIEIPDNNFKREVYQKFASPYFADKLERIGRDTKRKLKKNDRLLGPAYLCLENDILPFFILRATAYGFFYKEDKTPDSIEITQYVHRNGIEAAVEKYCELDLEDKTDSFVHESIVKNYREIEQKDIFPL